MTSIKRDLASGLVIVAPLAITFLAVRFLVLWIAGLPIVGAIDPWWLRIPTVLAVFVGLVMATGYLMRTTLGGLAADFVGDAINRVPVLRLAYNASRLAIETAIVRRDGSTEPVKVETWDGLRVTAFKTGNRTTDGRLLCFFPTAPNITTGYVIEVEESDVEPTGESIEDALTRLISAGFGDGSARAEDRPAGDGFHVVDRVRGVRLPPRE